jgi:tetratricopeptide (TPR) repeat protein
MTARQQFSQAQYNHQQGDWQQALVGYQQCLQDAQTMVAAHCNIASLLLQHVEPAQAIEHLMWLRQHQPTQLLWVEQLADAYCMAGLIPQAIEVMISALPQQLTPARWLDRIARYYQQIKQFAAAVAYQRWAIQVDQETQLVVDVQAKLPDWTLWFNLANHYLRWYGTDEQSHLLLAAEQAINAAQSIVVNDDIRQLHAEILGQAGRWQAALTQALAIENRHARVLNRIGVIYSELGQWAQALDYLQQAVAMDANYVAAQYHLANALSAIERYDDANRYYRQLCLSKPDWADAHLNLGLNFLACQRWVEGWREYEWRWQVAAYQRDVLVTSLPVCRSLKNITAPQLIWCEQGIGDTLMWLPWVLYLEQADIPFVLMLPDRLLPLVQRSYPHWTLLPRRAQFSAADSAAFAAHLSLGSLPHCCQQLDQKAAMPQPRRAYLHADQKRIAELKTCYGEGLRIGIAWQGGSGKQRALRSIELSEWQTLLEFEGIRWLCLQHGVNEKDLADIDRQSQQRLWCDFSIDPLLNMDDFAAQVSSMDLVITVDNSTAHLAGALGVETWVLLPETPEWRWPRRQGGMQASPWHQSVTLFYKTSSDWSDLFNQLTSRLTAWVAARRC